MTRRAIPEWESARLGWAMWWQVNGPSFLHSNRPDPGLGTTPPRSGQAGEPTSVARGTSALERLRAVARSLLLIGLQDPDPEVRGASALALGKVAEREDAEALEALLGLVADRSGRVRESACLALGLLANPKAVALLAGISADNEGTRAALGLGRSPIPARLRSLATLSLGLIGAGPGGALPDQEVLLLASLAERDDPSEGGLGGAPALALQLVQSRVAVPEMRRLFSDRTVDPVTRAHLGVALAKRGVRSAVEDMLRALGDPARIVRSSAAIGLGLIGDPRDGAVVAALRQAAARPSDPGTRNFALISLGRLGSTETVTWLLERLRRSRGTEKAFVALALGIAERGSARGEEDPAGLAGALLSEFKKTRDESLKGALAVALGLTGRRAAIGPLDGALSRNDDADLQGHLATALGLIGARSAAESIRAIAVKPRDPETLRRVAFALGRLQDRQALATIDRLTVDQPGTDRLAESATIALGLLGDRRVLPDLVERLGNRDAGRGARLRACAATAVGCVADKDAVPALARLAENANYLADTPLLRDLIGSY